MSEHDLKDRNYFVELIYSDKDLLINFIRKIFKISFDKAEDLFDGYILDFIEKDKINK